MRRKFGKILSEIAKNDKKIFLLVGDIGFGIFDDFRKEHPDRFLNLGICEQSLIGFASGMALEGLKPWVYTITPFLIERPFEQIKLDIDQQKANVKLVGFADYPSLGPSHSELDAKRTMKLFKNIKSFFPKTYEGGIFFCLAYFSLQRKISFSTIEAFFSFLNLEI